MAEPFEWIAIGEGVILAGESLGLIGTAAEIAEGAIITESAIGAPSVVGLDAAASTALAASEIGTTEAIVGTGMALGASEVAASTAGAATFDSMFASAAAEVALEPGPEVVQGASWAERAGSLASKAGTVGAAGVSVAKASPYILTGGDVASRVMSGEGVEEAIVSTAGDITKLGAKAVSFSIEELLNDIDPSILIVAGLGAYLYFSN